jgi:hypothetical protein
MDTPDLNQTFIQSISTSGCAYIQARAPGELNMPLPCLPFTGALQGLWAEEDILDADESFRLEPKKSIDEPKRSDRESACLLDEPKVSAPALDEYRLPSFCLEEYRLPCLSP